MYRIPYLFHVRSQIFTYSSVKLRNSFPSIINVNLSGARKTHFFVSSPCRKMTTKPETNRFELFVNSIDLDRKCLFDLCNIGFRV